MCIEDIAIARRTYTKTTTIAINTTTRIPANPDRLSVTLEAVGIASGAMTLSSSSADSLAGLGWAHISARDDSISNFSERYDLHATYRDYGALVQDDVWARIDSSNGLMTEVIMQDDLANEVRQFVQDKRDKYARR